MSVIKTGTVLLLETGCYSDYSFHGPFRVLKDFDQAEARDAFIEHWKANPEPNRYEGDRPDQYGFIAWMSSTGYVEDIEEARSWHIGDYEFEPEIDAIASEPTP